MHEKVLGFVSFGKERKGESENEQAIFFFWKLEKLQWYAN